MQPLSKDEAERIAELSSTVFRQGRGWVFSERDFETGAHRLSRGFNERTAKQKLTSWRRERVEELLRANAEQKAYALRFWQEMPNWNGEGIWQWVTNHWYTTRDDAEAAMERRNQSRTTPCEVFELEINELPGHFSVA